ncbi:MAG: RNA polymerase sigma factor [Chloroflexi bacterium]|nr:RNA polymerase sigma factor [Chloroflexota bacterium]
MESDLIDRARRGDSEAWETVVRQHQTPAFRLAYLLLGDADDAEDVAQEAFLRAFQKLDRFDTRRAFRPWLLSIVANLARNHRRSAGRYLAALRRFYHSEPEQDRTPGVEQGQLQQWEAQVLWQAIRRLRHDDQQIVYLRYFLELPVEEVAEALNIAPGTVKSRLHRALERLRAVIAAEFPLLAEERIP